MGVCTLIKKKEERKNHMFYRQSDFIWEEQKIAIRDEQTVVKQMQVQRTEEGVERRRLGRVWGQALAVGSLRRMVNGKPGFLTPF